MALNRNYSYVNLVSISVIGLMLFMFWMLKISSFSESTKNIMFYFLGFLILGHVVVSVLGLVNYPDTINKEYDD